VRKWAKKAIAVLSRWHRPCSEQPTLSARVDMDRRSGECVFVVYNDRGDLWSCKSVHPASVKTTYEREVEAVAKFIRKAVASLEKKADRLSERAKAWVDEHPAITEFMTLETNDDGSERTTSMLCVFYEAGIYKIALQDRQEGQSLWVSSQSIPEALDALESILQSGDGDWRPMRANGQGGKQQKRR